MTNTAIAVAAALLFVSLLFTTGRIGEHGGLGYDGATYARMMTEGVDAGTANTRLRPLVVLIDRAVFRAFDLQPIHAFVVANIFFAFLLGLGLAMLLEQQHVPAKWRAFFVCNAAVCISTGQMYSHYPAQVDLGALAFLVFAVRFAIAGPPWAAALAALAAVASREFGIAAVLFGVHRHLRLGGAVRGLLKYAPAVGLFAALRAAAASGPDAAGMVTVGGLLQNLRLWADPMFAVFVIYFVFTVFGGAGAWLLAHFQRLREAVRAEPELATFILPIVAVSAVTPDIWRYLTFVLPAAAVLFARVVAHARRPALAMAAIAGFTLLTQRPWRRITDNIYFGEWFPYYDWFPAEGPPAGMAEAWVWRAALAAGLFGVMLAVAHAARPTDLVTRAVRV